MLIKCLKQGIKNRNSVLNRVGKSEIFVLNRVRIWGAAPHLPTQGYIEYPPGVADPQNSPKNTRYREIRLQYYKIHVGKTYLILILTIIDLFYSPQTSKFILKKVPGVLRWTLRKKLGTSHNINSFSIHSFLERIVVERVNDYLY